MSRITRTGRDWLSPTYMSDWQRERSEGSLLPMEAEQHGTGVIAGGAAFGLLSFLWAPVWLAVPFTVLGLVLLIVWLRGASA